MHFAGVFSREPSNSAQWARKLSELVLGFNGSYESYALGSTIVIADVRLTKRDADHRGLLVSTGDLLPDAPHSVAEARRDATRLAHCLAGCRGNFAGVMVPGDLDQLLLFGDFLGVHPIYFADFESEFVFSTSLKAFRQLIASPLPLDNAGLLATVAVGYSFGDKTPYRNVSCIDAAQVLIVDRLGHRKQRYWDWRTADVEPVNDLDALADEVHQEFVDAVRAREQPETASLTLLSGGMDSRSILAAQVALGNQPRTMCISHNVSLDAALARRVATAFNCSLDLLEIPFAAFSAVGGIGSVVHDIIALRQHGDSNVTRVWSGDGGSVGLGAVYLSPETIKLAVDAPASAWIDQYIAENDLIDPSSKLFTAQIRPSGFLRRAILEEVHGYRLDRHGQVPYRFLMLNDQRRHLHYLFEIDMRIPLEFVTPFWDSRFLRAVLKCPDMALLQHRFYLKFFEHLPPIARAIPWQTYPGHVACPIPIPDGYEYQWGQYRHRRGDIDKLRRSAQRLLRACTGNAFPSAILRRSTSAAIAAHILLGRDYKRGYLLGQAEVALDLTSSFSTKSYRSATRSATDYLEATPPKVSA